MTVTLFICVRDKIEAISGEKRKQALQGYFVFWVTWGIHKVLLSERGQKESAPGSLKDENYFITAKITK